MFRRRAEERAQEGGVEGAVLVEVAEGEVGHGKREASSAGMMTWATTPSASTVRQTRSVSASASTAARRW